MLDFCWGTLLSVEGIIKLIVWPTAVKGGVSDVYVDEIAEKMYKCN